MAEEQPKSAEVNADAGVAAAGSDDGVKEEEEEDKTKIVVVADVGSSCPPQAEQVPAPAEAEAKPEEAKPEEAEAASASTTQVDSAERPAAEAIAPATPRTGRPAKHSVLGLAIGSPPSTPNRHGRPRINVSLSDRLMKRYQHEVQAAEANRKKTYVPMDGVDSNPEKQETTKTKDMEVRAVASSIKLKLDGALQAAKVSELGMAPWGPAGWDALLGSDDAKKELQFLSHHAKNGHFTERYGAEGHYEGEFSNGMRHGQGTHTFRGETYTGEWKWDKRHGTGTLTSANGSVACGTWLEGKQHGFCRITSADGAVLYEGEFKNGKRHGLGRQVFDSGDIYDGCWQEGRLHDRGVYHFVNGDKFYGSWSDGVYDGAGVFHQAGGTVSRRVYKEGRLMSVQDYAASAQKFGRALTREGMQRHTADRGFPSDIFLLGAT